MPPTDITHGIPPKRILVVDDEPHVAKTIKMVLSLNGHSVELAEDVEQGLRMYEAGKYDLVVTDFALGKLTGLDLAHSIRAKCPTQPIILITAYGESFGFGKDRLANINLLIGKPFSLEELNAGLAKVFPNP